MPMGPEDYFKRHLEELGVKPVSVDYNLEDGVLGGMFGLRRRMRVVLPAKCKLNAEIKRLPRTVQVMFMTCDDNAPVLYANEKGATPLISCYWKRGRGATLKKFCNA